MYRGGRVGDIYFDINEGDEIVPRGSLYNTVFRIVAHNDVDGGIRIVAHPSVVEEDRLRPELPFVCYLPVVLRH